jgi:hypothetical protein
MATWSGTGGSQVRVARIPVRGIRPRRKLVGDDESLEGGGIIFPKTMYQHIFRERSRSAQSRPLRQAHIRNRHLAITGDDAPVLAAYITNGWWSGLGTLSTRGLIAPITVENGESPGVRFLRIAARLLLPLPGDHSLVDLGGPHGG